MAHDLATAQDFYTAVLGWRYKPGIQGRGDYAVALVHGSPVAGLAAGARLMGFPVCWTAYFAAASANRTAARVHERGATIAVGPIPFGRGRVLWAADPDNAVFGIWEGEVDPDWRAGRHAGVPARLELRTRDPFASALFYGGVFDWDAQRGEGRESIDIGYEDDRVVLRIADEPVADLLGGAVEAAPDPRVRPQWHVYFRVDSTDAAAAAALAAGGTIVSPPDDSPFGRTAALRDPEGGLFHVSEPEG
ncbi:VOC family protein [Streptomyces pathocidini]|uniref:VOC family protein n=1 Tax=Streptomyces pathocidini TaxID=1650571 RepID=UPI0033F1FE11